MIVTPCTHDIDFLKSDLVRTPGLHASDIYGELYKQLEPKRYDFDESNPVLMALGSAWETHFEKLLELNGITAYRPGELISPEGIAYSPDLIVFNDHTRVGEIKLTSMSLDDIPDTQTSGLPPKFDKYMAQMMLYAYWMELMHGWLAVCSIRKPWAPVFRAFDLAFTERELHENHQMHMNYGKETGFL